MIRLTSTDLISLITAQNGARAVVSYSDATGSAYTGGTQPTSITSATTTTICSSPAASIVRDIDFINIKNTFAGSHTITVQLNVSATLYVLVTMALLTDESLSYTHGSGWCAIDANGNRKEVTSSIFSSITVTGLTASLPVFTDASKALVSNAMTGTGNVVMSALPTFSKTLGVGAATASSSGSGVTFPATQDGSTNANTLDDYEEGTWTPGVGDLTLVGDFSSSGTYTKIGRQVLITGRADSTTSLAGAAGTHLTGLPFTVLTPSCFGVATNATLTVTFGVDAEATTTDLYIVEGFAATTGIKFTVSHLV